MGEVKRPIRPLLVFRISTFFICYSFLDTALVASAFWRGDGIFFQLVAHAFAVSEQATHLAVHLALLRVPSAASGCAAWCVARRSAKLRSQLKEGDHFAIPSCF